MQGLKSTPHFKTTSGLISKGFEFIADLNNWGKLKPSQDEFVNLFMV